MQLKFKIYGYEKSGAKEQLLALEKVSLCFSDPAEVQEFVAFLVRECQGVAEKRWDHVDYIGADGASSITIALLDPKNR